MGTLPTSSIALPFVADATAGSVLLIVYLVLATLFLGHWIVASYHWYTYGSDRRISLLSMWIYGVGGLVLLGAMGMLLIAM